MSVVTAAAHARATLLDASRPAAALLAAVLAGAVLTTWVSEAVLIGSAEPWITYHQTTLEAYSRSIPPLGALVLIAALAAVAAARSRPRERRILGSALACMLVGLVVTAVVHFPINAEIATWDPSAPPTGWRELQHRWIAAHVVRTVLTVLGLALLVTAGAPWRRNRAAR